jgi:hypothetical protein
LNRNEGGGGTENESGKKRIDEHLETGRMTTRMKGSTDPAIDFLIDRQSVVEEMGEDSECPLEKNQDSGGLPKPGTDAILSLSPVFPGPSR